jgi:pectin methylesterase-like acyl-CoA thioesterase
LTILIGAVVFLSLGSVSISAVITVDDDAPANFKSIQKAVNAAKNGDVIRLAAGKYEERITVTKNITIQGAGTNLTVITLPENQPQNQPIVPIIPPNSPD